MTVRALALTLDLDGPGEYAGLHGLCAADVDPLLMYQAPLARFLSLCDSLGAVATLFAIGRDVEHGAGAKLRPLVKRGFEIGAHSYAHDYAMSLRSTSAAIDDIAKARDAITVGVGQAPVGFRAPGYLTSTAMLDALEALDFFYDSSVLPSPSYYAAKLAVVMAYKLLGKDPTSRIGSPRSTTAPTTPYRPGTDPYEKGVRKLVELPITVATPAGLPLTTAALVLAPKAIRALMGQALHFRDVIIVNAHAIDFADARADGIPADIAAKQPELRIPVDDRLEIVRNSIAQLLRDRAPMTCATIARCVS